MTEPTIQQLFDLSGRTALVTGGAGYLGGTLAAALAEAGAQVVISSRDRKRADDAVAKLPNSDAKHFAVEFDHKDEEGTRDGFQEAVAQSGGIDILFNNGQAGPANDWSDITFEGVQDHLANAAGYFELARLMRNHAVRRNKPASVVMIGSMYGQVASYPDAYEDICPASSVGYHALKGGVIHMTRHLAVYWAEDNVRVNCLSPGPFPHPSVNPKLVERLCAKSPMGRMGVPSELKGVAILLASDAGSYITGQNIVVDGGWTSW